MRLTSATLPVTLVALSGLKTQRPHRLDRRALGASERTPAGVPDKMASTRFVAGNVAPAGFVAGDMAPPGFVAGEMAPPGFVAGEMAPPGFVAGEMAPGRVVPGELTPGWRGGIGTGRP